MKGIVGKWLIADTTVRFYILNTLYPALTLQGLLRVIRWAPLFRYRRLTDLQKRGIFARAIYLSRQSRPRAMAHVLTMYWMDAHASLHIGLVSNDPDSRGQAWVESDKTIFSPAAVSTDSQPTRYGAKGKLII
jgi:hypothetical protein